MTDEYSHNWLLGSLLAASMVPKRPAGLLEHDAISADPLGLNSAPGPAGLMALGAHANERATTPNALARHAWGSPTAPLRPMTGNALSSGAPSLPILERGPPRQAPRRNVFFSFHFQADINRVNIVRNSWRIRPEDHVPGFFDRSLWERRKLTDAGALKRMIRDGLRGTSVTCVLAGEFTWERPWVRYEIAESVAQKNGLLTVDVDELRCMSTGAPCRMGPNPLSYMGVYRARDGLAYICEFTERGWVQYDLLKNAVPWPAHVPERGTVNDAHPLSLGAGRYVYRPKSGAQDLSRWVADAARAARRS